MKLFPWLIISSIFFSILLKSSTVNGYYFDGEVKGFQFYLQDITLTGATGGTAEQYLDLVHFSAQTGKVLGTSFGATAVIPIGTDVLLTTIAFSNAGDKACFVESGSGCVVDGGIEYNATSCNGGVFTLNIVADNSGDEVNGDWNDSCTLAIYQAHSALPEAFAISQNFPNPFNPVTAITFDVAEMDEISLVVYDLTGKEVVTLVSGTYTPGTYNVEWDAVNNAGDDIASGMYIYRYVSSEKAITRKMLYLK